MSTMVDIDYYCWLLEWNALLCTVSIRQRSRSASAEEEGGSGTARLRVVLCSRSLSKIGSGESNQIKNFKKIQFKMKMIAGTSSTVSYE